MSKLIPFITILFGLSTCAQKNDLQKVYSDISKTFCSCVNKDTLRNSRDIADSCLKVSLNQNYSLIQKENLDSSSSNPSFYRELSKKIKINCPEFQERVAREVRQREESEYKKRQEEQKTTYSGSFISQKKLSNGEFEVIVKSTVGNHNRTFISSIPIDENIAKIQGTKVSIKFEPNTSSLQAKYEFRAKLITLIQVEVKVSTQ